MWPFLKRYVGKVIVGGCVAITFCDIVGHPAVVRGNSMMPTLFGGNSRWWECDIVWLTSYGVSWGTRRPEVGDIVTFTPPKEPRNIHIKRISALEGDMVRPKDRDMLMLVPTGTYWMESDNPLHANDSNVYGPVSHGLLRGRATHVIWPPEHWRSI